MASESRLGHEKGTGHLAPLCSWELAVSIPRGSRLAAWTVVQPPGWVSFIWSRTPPISCPWWWVLQCSPIQGPVCGYGQEINNKPNWRSNTAYQESQGTAFIASLLSYLCCPDISLQWKRADWRGALGSPGVRGRWAWPGGPRRPLFSCCGLQVTPGPRLLTMQIQ